MLNTNRLILQSLKKPCLAQMHFLIAQPTYILGCIERNKSTNVHYRLVYSDAGQELLLLGLIKGGVSPEARERG